MVYTKTLPDLTKATRAKAYERLSALFSHMDAMNMDITSLTIDPLTRIITVTVSRALTDDELDHFGML